MCSQRHRGNTVPCVEPIAVCSVPVYVSSVSLENRKVAKGVGDATWSDVEASGCSREAMRMHRYTFSGYTGLWKD